MTYWVAIPFVPMERGLTWARPAECRTEASAIRRAEAMSRYEPMSERLLSRAVVIRTLASSKTR
jgi:hypothetical protein